MPLLIGFGKNAALSFEQLPFRYPGYYTWIMKEKIHQDLRKYGKVERERIDAIYRRASHLKIPRPCVWCRKDSPVTRMFVTKHISGGLGAVGFDCDKCRYLGGSESHPVTPSLFGGTYYRAKDRGGEKILIDAVKYEYFFDFSYQMTKKRADEFFNNPANFTLF